MNSDLSNYQVRRMNRADMNHPFAWSAREGWNIGRFDHDCFYETDPNGFFIGEVDGEPVGSISGVAYEENFGFIGIYIVRPEFRGKGYGVKLFEAAMNHLSHRNVGLDGVIAQQENYRRSGFRLAYRNIRYGGVAALQEAPEGCIPLSEIPFDRLCAYDRLHFPASRPQFLKGWLRLPEATALCVMRDGALVGWGMIRSAIQGNSIAPLAANDPQTADLLFCALAAQRPEQPFFMDVPEVNREAVALAERYGMKPIFETARMYTGAFPDLPMNEIFGVTTLELG